MGFFNSLWNTVKGAVSSLNPVSVVGDIIGAGASIATTAMTNKNNQKLQDSSQQFTTSEREASQEYQTAERKEQQLYQTQEREAQNAYNTQFYENYQSPQAMAEQYAAAGLNPRLAADGGAAGTASSGSSGSAPSSGAPSGAVVSPPYQQASVMGQTFRDIAAAVSSMANARKLGTERDQAEQIFGKLLSQYDLSNEAQAIANSINKTKFAFLGQKEQLAVFEQLQKLQLGKYSIEQAQEILGKLKNEKLISDVDYRYHEQQIKASLDLQKSQKGELDTRSSLHEAAASLAKAQRLLTYRQAETEKMRPELIKQQKNLLIWQNKMASWENLKLSSLTEDEIRNKKEELDQFYSTYETQKKILEEKLRKAEKENNWYEVQQIRDLITASAQLVNAANNYSITLGYKRNDAGASPDASSQASAPAYNPFIN